MVAPPPLRTEPFRAACDALARVARGDAQVAALVVGEVLLDQAAQRSTVVSQALVEARMGSHGVSEATCAIDGIAPFTVLREGPHSDAERALVSVLSARHIGALLDGTEGVSGVRELLPQLDWLEFTGPYAPYSAARVALTGDTLQRLEQVLRDAPIESSSDAGAAAVRALRGLSASAGGETLATVREAFPAGLRAGPDAEISVAGEVEGMQRGWVARALGIVTGWSVLRGVFVTLGRIAFSFRRPMTVSLDGDVLRVVGHTEILGRTLRTFDVRYPIDQLVEIRREVRFPALPVAVSLVGLAAGALFGARAVVEGAGVSYFPLVGLGIGLILGGLVFDLLVRALFPGLLGQGRVVLRARDARAIVLSRLAIEEADKLLDAMDRRFRATPAGPSPKATRGRPARRP
ncbi:MAG: hypothetical protein WCJ30_21260 [Deltaproteobacteria bacterium]